MALTAVLEVLPMASTAISILELALVRALRAVIVCSIGWGCTGSSWHGNLLSSVFHCCERSSMGTDR
jgi:hypothetical protein